jgi:hypothetical protein
MVICLTSARFNMKADILRQSDGQSTPTSEGEWRDYQDPITGEIIRKWYPVGDNPATPDDNEGVNAGTMPVMARGIIDGGIRVAGTTETWGETYIDIDYVRIEFPASYILTKRDRITNIRDKKGHIVWLEEELGPEDADSDPDTPKTFRATVFNVKGVTPVIDPFGRHSSNVAMLERANVQQNA